LSEAFIIIMMLIFATAIIASAVTSTLALLQANRTHLLINSRMDQLIALTKKEAIEEGRQTERDSHL
jgi:hypothetical protein